MLKKGFIFMHEDERAEILRNFRWVDDVYITKYPAGTKDISVCDALREVHPDVFANGGDRKLDNVPEVAVCKEIGCEMVFNIGRGGKVQSSSELVTKTKKQS